MSTEAHISELEKKHADLERQIEEELAHPGADDLHINRLKRQKLQLKDQIVKLKSENNTLH